MHTILYQGLVNVPIEYHPSIGDIISNRYLKVMFKIPKKGHLPTPVIAQTCRCCGEQDVHSPGILGCCSNKMLGSFILGSYPRVGSSPSLPPWPQKDDKQLESVQDGVLHVLPHHNHASLQQVEANSLQLLVLHPSISPRYIYNYIIIYIPIDNTAIKWFLWNNPAT